MFLTRLNLGLVVADLGWVDMYLGHSTDCPVLFGLMTVWHSQPHPVELTILPVQPVHITRPKHAWTGHKYRPVRVNLRSLGGAESNKLDRSPPHRESPIDRSDVPRRRNVVFLFAKRNDFDSRKFRFERIKSFLSSVAVLC